jgi:3-hydroxyisobutyrate dehydrogenase-like beta-hydroxyacid dehydrogenase
MEPFVATGTHVLITVEALAFLDRLDVTRGVFLELLLKSSGASFILGDRGVHTLRRLTQPAKSAISIWTKDMGLVVDEAGSLGMPTFLSACAQQYFVEGASRGWGKDDDSR